MNKNTAFTLTEVLMVTIILSILVVIALPNYSNAVEKARSRQAKADLLSINVAVANYRAKIGTYPGTLNSLADIKTTFRLENLDTGDFNYQFTPGGAGNYTITATRNSAPAYTWSLNGSQNNPVCSAGPCPVIQ